MATALSGHIIVCGLDGIGVTIVEQLHRSGQQVVVLEQFATHAQLSSIARLTTAVVASSSSLEHTLETASVATASAIVCVVAQDLQNVQLSLQARHMNPQIRVVSQLTNNAVRRAMAVDNGPGAVIDGASLAAPSIVEACLGRRLHEMQFGTTTFTAVTVPVNGGTLRSMFGDLAPVAVTRPGIDGDRPTVFACPGRDFATEPGDEATMLGTPDELLMWGIASTAAPAEPPHKSHLLRRIVATVRAAISEFDPGVYRALAVLLSLITLSTFVLHWSYKHPGMSILDGLYFSVETVATVGFGDFSFADQDSWLRLWAIFLMLSGITTTAVLMAYVADFLISRRLNHSIGRRRARGMSGHVIVVGLGAFGLQVASALQTVGRQVVVIERDERNRFLSEAAALDLPIIFGDATSTSTLETARLRDAAAMAILTSNDMVNIETGIAVRDMLDDRWVTRTAIPVVMRVFDQSLSRTISARFGFENIQSIEEITAPWFVAAALGLEVLGAFSVAQQPFTIGRLPIAADSGLVGVAMQGLSANTRVIALQRKATGVLEHPPRRGTRFEEGDLAYIVGPNDELIGVLRTATAAVVSASS